MVEGVLIRSDKFHCIHAQSQYTNPVANREKGMVCILDIDVQGVRAVIDSELNPNTLYIAPPNREALKERLMRRGTETPDTLERRITNAIGEMEWLEKPGNVHHTIVNNDLDVAFQQMMDHVMSLYPHLKEE